MVPLWTISDNCNKKGIIRTNEKWQAYTDTKQRIKHYKETGE